MLSVSSGWKLYSLYRIYKGLNCLIFTPRVSQKWLNQLFTFYKIICKHDPKFTVYKGKHPPHVYCLLSKTVAIYTVCEYYSACIPNCLKEHMQKLSKTKMFIFIPISTGNKIMQKESMFFYFCFTSNSHLHTFTKLHTLTQALALSWVRSNWLIVLRSQWQRSR